MEPTIRQRAKRGRHRSRSETHRRQQRIAATARARFQNALTTGHGYSVGRDSLFVATARTNENITLGEYAHILAPPFHPNTFGIPFDYGTKNSGYWSEENRYQTPNEKVIRLRELQSRFLSKPEHQLKATILSTFQAYIRICHEISRALAEGSDAFELTHAEFETWIEYLIQPKTVGIQAARFFDYPHFLKLFRLTPDDAGRLAQQPTFDQFAKLFGLENPEVQSHSGAAFRGAEAAAAWGAREPVLALTSRAQDLLPNIQHGVYLAERSPDKTTFSTLSEQAKPTKIARQLPSSMVVEMHADYWTQDKSQYRETNSLKVLLRTEPSDKYGGAQCDDTYIDLMKQRAQERNLGAITVSGVTKKEPDHPAQKWILKRTQEIVDIAKQVDLEPWDQLVVHLDLAKFGSKEIETYVLQALVRDGPVNSIGMNEGELRKLTRDKNNRNPIELAAEFAEEYKIDRVVLHSSRYAAIIYNAEIVKHPELEERALISATNGATHYVKTGKHGMPQPQEIPPPAPLHPDLLNAAMPSRREYVLTPTSPVEKTEVIAGAGDVFVGLLMTELSYNRVQLREMHTSPPLRHGIHPPSLTLGSRAKRVRP